MGRERSASVSALGRRAKVLVPFAAWTAVFTASSALTPAIIAQIPVFCAACLAYFAGNQVLLGPGASVQGGDAQKGAGLLPGTPCPLCLLLDCLDGRAGLIVIDP